MFRSLCPTVFELYDKISVHPVKQEDISSSLLYLYENFLMDLKVNLLGVDATLSLVDCIDNAINKLHAHERQEDVFNSSNIGIEDDTVKKKTLLVIQHFLMILYLLTMANLLP